ncbi:MAG: PspC domain-containing protein [Oscillospiraceae bacterium]|nr:PspC domain-containing protein [Oscillospiraceae bacterium]
MEKKLKKSSRNKMIFGVCGGIAEYFEVDPTIVRIITAVLIVAYGAGLLLYLIAALIMPSDS